MELYRECIDLAADDVPVARPGDHTMAGDLDSYVDQRVPLATLYGAVGAGATVEVHGIYPGHFAEVARSRGWRPDASAAAAELPGKALNAVRPRVFCGVDARGRPTAWAAVPPGRDYLRHFAGLVGHVVARRSREPVRAMHHPIAARELPRWTELDAGLLGGARTVVLGRVEPVEAALAGCRIVQRRATSYFTATTVEAPAGRVTLLGVRFSYWGCIGGRIAARCCELGVGEVLYVGKLGTLGAPAECYSRLFVPSSYAVLDGTTVRAMCGGPPNGVLTALPTLDSGLHVSVPTVLEEDLAQRELAELLGAATLDNELAQMALAVDRHNRSTDAPDVRFSAVHYATDYLRRPGEAALPLPFSLATGRRPDARRRRGAAERLVGGCLREYLIGGARPATRVPAVVA